MDKCTNIIVLSVQVHIYMPIILKLKFFRGPTSSEIIGLPHIILCCSLKEAQILLWATGDKVWMLASQGWIIHSGELFQDNEHIVIC